MNNLEIEYNIENDIIIIKESLAVRQKRSHQKYQKAHPEEMKLNCKLHNEKVKTNPESYARLLESKKQYYYNIVKPRKELFKIQ